MDKPGRAQRAHHPAGAHSGALGGVVRGVMIVLLMLLTWGFLVFALGQGVARPLILGGLMAYAVSLFAHIGAARLTGVFGLVAGILPAAVQAQQSR